MVWNTPRGAFKKFSTGRNFVFKTPCAFFHLIFFALFPVTATHVAFAPLVCNPKTHRHTTPKPNWEIVRLHVEPCKGGGGRDTKQKKSKRIKSKEFKTNLLPPNTMTINLVMEFSLSFRRQKSKSSCYILTLQLDFLLPLCFKFFFFPL